jgi:peptidoglycan/xylan/chitin deacetylase (PgdA/CDA1 family)
MTKRVVGAFLAGALMLSLLATGRSIGDAAGVPAQHPATPAAVATVSAPYRVGLGRRVPAHPPTPAAAQRSVRTTGVTGLLRSVPSGRAVALTFDDGPHPVWTPQVLDHLRAAGIKATFCLVGVRAQQYPALVQRIAREGHTLCNHSWQHDFSLGVRADSVIRADLIRTNQAIRRAVPGAEIRYFRQPGGKWTPAVIRVARDLGMVNLHWTTDPRDWERPGAEAVARRTLQRAQPGAIVLLHDGGGDRSGTAAACPYIIAQLQRRYGIALLR